MAGHYDGFSLAGGTFVRGFFNVFGLYPQNGIACRTLMNPKLFMWFTHDSRVWGRWVYHQSIEPCLELRLFNLDVWIMRTTERLCMVSGRYRNRSKCSFAF